MTSNEKAQGFETLTSKTGYSSNRKANDKIFGHFCHTQAHKSPLELLKYTR